MSSPAGSAPASARQFALVRVLLGLYLAVDFARLTPYAAALLSTDGAFAGTPPAPFPDLFRVLDGTGATVFTAVLALTALPFAAGVARRTTALVLWYGWACLVNLTPFLLVPSDGYVGWLLLACVVAPAGEERRDVWRLPATLVAGAWLVLALGYTASGVDKLASPSWQDGSALRLALESPIARVWWGSDAARQLPDVCWRLATWSFLALEIAFAPLCCFAVGRRVAWTAMTLAHVAVLALLDVTEVTVVMLIFHLLVVDPRWLPLRRRAVPGGARPPETALLAASLGAFS